MHKKGGLSREVGGSGMAVLGLDTPTKQGIFVTYVSLWVSSHLLVYRSKQAGCGS